MWGKRNSARCGAGPWLGRPVGERNWATAEERELVLGCSGQKPRREKKR